jgi:hypothetical protein
VSYQQQQFRKARDREAIEKYREFSSDQYDIFSFSVRSADFKGAVDANRMVSAYGLSYTVRLRGRHRVDELHIGLFLT